MFILWKGAPAWCRDPRRKSSKINPNIGIKGRGPCRRKNVRLQMSFFVARCLIQHFFNTQVCADNYASSEQRNSMCTDTEHTLNELKCEITKWLCWSLRSFSRLVSVGICVSMFHLVPCRGAQPAAQCGRGKGRWVESDYRVVWPHFEATNSVQCPRQAQKKERVFVVGIRG